MLPEGPGIKWFVNIWQTEDIRRRNVKTNTNGGRRSTFAGNSALLPTDVIDFPMLPAQKLLAGNNFIVRYHHVTLK